MILRCKHCLDLLVSLLSLVLPNARSPLRTNFSFVFRQEMKLPNVFAIWLARAKITKKKKMAVPTRMVSHLNRLGTKIPGLLSEYTIQCCQKYPKSLCLREKKSIYLEAEGSSTLHHHCRDPGREKSHSLDIARLCSERVGWWELIGN